MPAAPQAANKQTQPPVIHCWLLILITTALAIPPLATRADHHEEAYGVLVMAHGGTEEWDQAVLDAVEPLRDKYPVEVAFGMADASTIDESVKKLEASNVSRIGVVRLFISGESWYERTEQILGLIEGAPLASELEAEPEAHGGHSQQPEHDDHGAHSAMENHAERHVAAEPAGEGAHEGHGTNGDEEAEEHQMAPLYRIETDAAFALSTDGLAEAPEMDEVLLFRARSLSQSPEREDVLFLAHGPGDDAENERWIAKINERVDLLRQEIPFRRVEVMTLREDWPEKREEAEERIKAFVRRASEEGGQAIVIPYRVFGFGPYSEVLADLEYVSDGQGLIPHEAVTHWIGRQASDLRREAFRRPID